MKIAKYLPCLLLIGLAPVQLAGQIIPKGPPPYIPTPSEIVDSMLALGRFTPRDTVWDLGSGDGRIVLEAARRGAVAVGIEYDPELVLFSRREAERLGVANLASFREEDLFASDFSSADLLTLYLSTQFNVRLRPRILSDMRTGSRIVSHGFHMEGWQPDSTVTLGTGAERLTLFFWEVPAQLDGFWYLKIEGARGVMIEIDQEYQYFEGAISRDGRSLEVVNGKIRGTTFGFATAATRVDPERHFSGRFSEGRLEGMVDMGNGERRPWRAEPMGSR